MLLSVIIITRNEEQMLAGCIKSVKPIASEIIVVDSGSTDKTLSIAKRHQAKVIQILPSSDYSTSRNQGLKKAQGDWILYVDADERLTPELRKEIKSICQRLKVNGQRLSYKFPRQNIILGKWLRYGGFWPDPVHRLFHASALIKWTGKLHESPTTKGQTLKLHNPIKHFTARTVSAALKKSAQWSALEAQLLYQTSPLKVNGLKVLKAYFATAFKLLVIKKGILDGIQGIILAHIQAQHQASVLVHLWQMQQ